MRFTRKLVLLSAMALAAFAVSTSAASADVEVFSEETGEHCSPCVIHISSTAPTIVATHNGPSVEFVASICNDELEAEIYEDGEGHIYNQSLTGSNCVFTPCPGSEWPIHIREDEATHAETLTLSLCTRLATGSVFTCTASFAVDSSTHAATFGGDAPCINLGGSAELTGVWAMETGFEHGGIEIVH